ncbi:MmgE/PrpD family protein [Glaciibacter sp. 2TAF33]|uniref:MmgE/PrpD family protein n=1 Tax=Glaciibacter sp. 2TAF33 TaxID=3233015 RepID=UPI003F920B6C
MTDTRNSAAHHASKETMMTETIQNSAALHATSVDVAVILADHCIRADYDSLPGPVIAATKNQIIDTLGIALAGSEQPGARQLRELTMEMAGKPEARIWGTDIRVPAQDAARVNATMTHALDYDDTYERSFVHPSAITIPAALATAEMLGGVTGKELITAVALGVDVACRLANSARPGVTGFVHGWHNTTLYGYFASAVVAGKLMGLTRDELVSALGVAYQQASGNSQAHIDGALTKRMGPGFASYGGLLSARLAQRGVHGAKGVFEGVRGFFFQYHGNDYSREILLDGLGSSFCGADVAFKPWPSCRGSHTAVDAALSLFTDAGIQASDVSEITIYNGPGDYSLLASPIAKKQRPDSPVDAQFSNPWVVAAALVDGKVGLEHFTPAAIHRPDLLAATQLIRTAEDASLVRAGGGPGAARIEARTTDGRTLTRTVAYAKGEPGNPMSPDEFRQKFLDCTMLAGMSKSHGEELFATVSRLETLSRAEQLTAESVVD